MVERKSFRKLKSVIQPPYLIEIQTKSYQDFLQWMSLPESGGRRGSRPSFTRCSLSTATTGVIRLIS